MAGFAAQGDGFGAGGGILTRFCEAGSPHEAVDFTGTPAGFGGGFGTHFCGGRCGGGGGRCGGGRCGGGGCGGGGFGCGVGCCTFGFSPDGSFGFSPGASFGPGVDVGAAACDVGASTVPGALYDIAFPCGTGNSDATLPFGVPATPADSAFDVGFGVGTPFGTVGAVVSPHEAVGIGAGSALSPLAEVVGPVEVWSVSLKSPRGGAGVDCLHGGITSPLEAVGVDCLHGGSTSPLEAVGDDCLRFTSFPANDAELLFSALASSNSSTASACLLDRLWKFQARSVLNGACPFL